MSFELRDRDLLGRIGKLEAKSGTIETPLLLPVINPSIQSISPKAMQRDFDCRAVMTNAYIIKKHFEEAAVENGVHRFLDFDGVVMTDSGAYQNLVYGEVEILPAEIVRFQEEIDTDIATILDVPTGWGSSEEYAQYTVDETVQRARRLSQLKTRGDIAWVGPVQGGQYSDLMARSAREMGDLPFEIHALGSPTPVMEQYLFDTLVQMIMTAKMNLPAERPLHLFGAGHPFMFSLAVALGCDLFDSAAYAKYAREGRYLKVQGTTRLRDLRYFPCSCPVCREHDPEEMLKMENVERQRLLAEHNLHVSFSEIKLIKQAIVEGRLWEHLELRAHGHPSLLKALKRLGKYAGFLETQSPVSKASGLFFFSSLGLARPEVVRHRRRLLERSSPPRAGVLLLLPQTQMKPFHKSNEHQKTLRNLGRKLEGNIENLHVCTYAAPFGVVPKEVDEVYPLSQYQITTPHDLEMIAYVAKQVRGYILTRDYREVILVQDIEAWKGKIAAACKRACEKRGISLKVLDTEKLGKKVDT
jgi:7-cyano-7-deazaguanine tRNA-ribosyltransferase